jgi:uncharacterized protein YecE (DUF72 family)
MIHVGTSGWQYDSWKDGAFYAKGTPQRDWLRYYAGRFAIVEVNNSFYRLPEVQTFDRWRRGTPDGFLFVIKASRYITHVRRLRDCREPLELFWRRASLLEEKLGPVLFQFPPNLRVDLSRLEDFLHILPHEIQAAFEFRDESWRTDDALGLLDRAGAACVLADRPGWRVPAIVTGGWAYIRFHQGQPRRPGYTREKLRRWAGRIAGLDARQTYVFFNNDQGAAAPADAATLIDLLEKRAAPVATPGS